MHYMIHRRRSREAGEEPSFVYEIGHYTPAGLWRPYESHADEGEALEHLTELNTAAASQQHIVWFGIEVGEDDPEPGLEVSVPSVVPLMKAASHGS